jgi:tetratricopeptide (TPR) repeat protein
MTNDLEFASTVNFFYENVKKKNPNYFELFGIPTNATHKEIETAYQKYNAEFSEQKAAAISDPKVKEQINFLVQLAKRGYEVLTDFKLRGEYEKKGYREIDPDAIKEEDPEETAREIYKRTKTLYTMKNYDLAIKALEEAVSLDPKKADYFLLLGKCQSEVPEQKRKAEINLQKACELEAWNAEPIVALGMLFYSERLYKRAEGYFKKALIIQNDHPVARKKYAELAGPEAKSIDKMKAQVQDGLKKGLGKVFPTFFGKKKR